MSDSALKWKLSHVLAGMHQQLIFSSIKYGFTKVKKNKTIWCPHSPTLFLQKIAGACSVELIYLRVGNTLCQSGRVISQDLKCPVQMLHTTALAEYN